MPYLFDCGFRLRESETTAGQQVQPTMGGPEQPDEPARRKFAFFFDVDVFISSPVVSVSRRWLDRTRCLPRRVDRVESGVRAGHFWCDRSIRVFREAMVVHWQGHSAAHPVNVEVEFVLLWTVQESPDAHASCPPPRR